ncbi:MAG TPA: hypothetical protein VEW42_03945, partial [Candidatus Eisenbacteria bacterium]|nr:hypothetical protein [Candidatus Eisenbacteria bacterium]
ANHLVSFGTMGSGQPGSSVYKAIHALPTINVLEYHDYNTETVAFPASLSRRFNDSIALNKPLIVGESGISLSKYTAIQRATYFDNKMNAYFSHGGTSYLLWSYRDANLKDTGYSFTFTDPLASVVKKYATSPIPLVLGTPTVQSKIKISREVCKMHLSCYFKVISAIIHH